ncbi:citrate synthase [Myceligenerans indicum]|uniref:Citrate synthase n=1 Tax=Myceligenerans indicum TaxID=2593663 RepID=A0ABS1LK75_9MICO|nr:citrate synthase [Myceligenerans indicum]MBL0886634.1 citrate synthase [Myceligenerans indicum]
MTSTTPANATSTVELVVDGTARPLSVVGASEGASGFKVNTLLRDTGLVTLDPGFTNTASCESAITYIDGDQGILRYRGYPIDQVAEGASFLEVAALLIDGELPDAAALAAFEQRVGQNAALPDGFAAFLEALPATGHPMATLAAALNALAAWYPDVLDPRDEAQVASATAMLLAKTSTITSALHRRRTGLPLVAPDASNGYVADFLRRTFGSAGGEYAAEPVIVDALEKLLILHADHEQNCSTSTVRVVGSSNATLFASVAAGVNALSGPAHGGANEAVLVMLEKIRSGGETVETFMNKVKNKQDGVRLMGFGHRVYKSYDPRAAIVKKSADEVLEKLGAKDELLEIAQGLEQIALSGDYFVERKLYPNVDFYTGLIYKAMGFEPAMFTPLFALGRMPGWIAQWQEMVNDPATKIGRPRQVYTGATERSFVPVSQR